MEGCLFDNRYKLVRSLSREGGTADVWLARDTATIDDTIDEEEGTIKKLGEETGILVAIKVYRPQNGLDTEGEQMFRDEYKIVHDCHHSNLLQPSNFSIYEGIPYLVLPFCNAGSSQNLVGKLKDPKEIWKFIYDVASGLSYLHTNNPVIIHQDIKPANILIDKRNNYVITDFGISTTSGIKDAESSERNSGTFAYMAPERFDYDSNPSISCDIWSLGATLYELLTGIPPYGQGGGGAQLEGTKRQGKMSGIPSSVKKLIIACLSLDPKNRPTAQDLVLAAQSKKFPASKSALHKIVKLGCIASAAIIAAFSLLVLIGLYLDDPEIEAEDSIKSTIIDPYTIDYALEEPDFCDTIGLSTEFIAKYKEYYLYVQSPDFSFSDYQKILDWKWINIIAFQKLDKNEHFQWRLTALEVIRKTLLKDDNDLSSDLAHREYGKYADDRYAHIFLSPVVREAILRTYHGYHVVKQMEMSKDISNANRSDLEKVEDCLYTESDSFVAMKQARNIIRKGGKVSDFLAIPSILMSN